MKKHKKFSVINIMVAIALLSFGTNCYAENWIYPAEDNKTILLDTDSIIKSGDNVYYNVKYYEKTVSEDVVVTILGNEKQAGVVQTCKISEYEEDSSQCSTQDLDKQPKKFNDITPESLLYNANLKAVEMATYSYDDNYNFEPYMFDVQKKIRENWNPPKGNESEKIIIIFKIAKDGRLLACDVTESSGNPKADKAAMDAINISAPFNPLPDDYNKNDLDVKFTFDYNVLRK